jgi:S1-C subfamily serine protease
MGVLTEFSNELKSAVEKAGRSIVLVDARKRYPASGIAFTEDLVLTADHVITRESDLKVQDAGGQTYGASVAGRDAGSDLAVLRLDARKLVPAKVADAAAQVGQMVLAVGRPNEAGMQASWGIVTSIGGPARTGRGGLLPKFLQTETTPYPGFSGGALIDTNGAILGLNTSGLTPGSSLTIPADVAWPIGESLARDGKVRRGYLGVRTQPVELPEGQGRGGLLIIWLEEGGPAAQGGLLVGDILTAIANERVSDPDDIFSALGSATVGKPIEIGVLRGGKAQSVRVTVGERQ